MKGQSFLGTYKREKLHTSSVIPYMVVTVQAVVLYIYELETYHFRLRETSGTALS